MKKNIVFFSKIFMMLLIIVSLTSTGYLNSLDENLEVFDVADKASAICNGAYAGTQAQCEHAGGVWTGEGGASGFCSGAVAGTQWACETAGGYWSDSGGGGGGGGGFSCPVGEVLIMQSDGTIKCGPLQPVGTPKPTPEITCPSGTNKVGTGSSAYCEKTIIQNNYVTSCPSGMTLVGSGASAYCKQNVTQKENVNINLGDITNNLNGKDFGGANNHNSSLVVNTGNGNSDKTVNNLDGKDNNFINFTNVPVDGKVTSLTNIWKPEFTVTINGKLLKAPKPSDASQLQQHNTALSEFTSQAGVDNGSNHTTVEAILYKVSSINELNAVTKDKASLLSVFDKNSSGEYLKKEQIKYSHINKQGLINYENFQTNQEGLYILATKYVDQSKEDTLSDKTTYTFKPLEINFLNTAGYLPLSNFVAGQVNDIYMSVGLKKKDHGLNNLSYSNDTKTYKSMKVPSSHNYANNHSLLGSTNGGISLVDSSLNKVAVVSSTVDVATIKVSDIVDNEGGFFISSDKGISYLDVDTRTVSSTSITNGILDIEVVNDTLYALSEDKLMVYFVVGKELIPSNKVYDLTGLFSSNKKPGKFEIIGGVLTVSTVDEGSESEVIFLTNK